MKSSENIALRKATMSDAGKIWEIIQQAIERRRKDGSQQWQNGYPNPEVIKTDIEKNQGFIMTVDGETAVYGALIFNHEPAYENIDGAWLSEGDFLVIHRVAVDEKFQGKGLVKTFFEKTEEFAKTNNVFSVKVDTNFDNGAMLHILEKMGYTFCGEVFLAGAPRKAFEKILK